MSKQITFTHEGREFTLEFTRNTVQQMERNGFVASDIERTPMSVLPALWSGAFLAHHRYVKQDVVDAIFAKIKDKQALIGKLAEMYNEPFLTLLEDPEEDEGNVEWTANW